MQSRIASVRDPPQSTARHAFVLMQILSGPGEERIELVRVEQKINDERDRSQHEHEISHEGPGVLGVAVGIAMASTLLRQ